MKARVAVLDDEQRMVEILTMILSRDGHDVRGFLEPQAALDSYDADPFDLLITDLRMPQLDGVEVLKRLRAKDAHLPVILITAHATVATAVAALREGAFDYVQKPFDNDELRVVVNRALDHTRLERENRYLRAEVRSRYSLDGVVAESEAMRAALDLARRAAKSPATVLVSGESGTGKELVARSVHYHSDRVGGPFVAVNCKALAAGVLESELFGHERGAFTGADRSNRGLFETAGGGTLFLDEIGDIDAEFQAKLLRVLQEKTVRRVGGSADIAVDVRVVAATNKDLRVEASAGNFREDLYFRLAVIPITLTPLRERREDVLPLARHFLEKWSAELGRVGMSWAEEVERYLLSHAWPGNVRELENGIERAVVLAREATIELGDIVLDAPGDTVNAADGAAGRDGCAGGDGKEPKSLREFLDVAARDRIHAALEQAGGTRTEAARALDIDRATLYRLMRKYEID